LFSPHPGSPLGGCRLFSRPSACHGQRASTMSVVDLLPLEPARSRSSMQSGLPLGHTDDPQFQQLLTAYDAPAFLRRDRRVREAYDHVLERCRRQRHEWLGMVRTRLGALAALAGTWETLLPLVANPEQIALLRAMDADLQPNLRAPIDR